MVASQVAIASMKEPLIIQYVALKLIDEPPWDDLRDLDINVLEGIGASKREIGWLQPVLLRPKENGRYERVFGRHRISVAHAHGDKTVPAVVKRIPDDETVLISISENIHRNTKVDPVREGLVFDELCQKGWDETRIARKIGKDYSYVMKRLTIARKLHPKLASALSRGKITLDAAHAVSKHPLSQQLQQMNIFRGRVQGTRLEELITSPSPPRCSHACPLHCP